MKRFFIYVLFITLLAVVSCTPSRESIYKTDYPLTSDCARSINTDLIVNIPAGWISVDENKSRSIDLWLIKEDFSSTIIFTPIHIDEHTYREIKEKDDLQAALNYSKTFRKALLGNGFKQSGDDEYFDINKRPFAAYRYINEEDLPVRVAVFRFAQYYYESSAEIKSVGKLSADSLFTIQNSVLSSLK